MNSTFLIICYHSSFPKKRGKKGKLLPTQERRSEIIGFPKVQTSSFLSQLSVKKCMCELGDFYIFHELLVAGGEKREFYFCYVITLQFSGRHSTSMDNSYEQNSWFSIFSLRKRQNHTKNIDSFLETNYYLGNTHCDLCPIMRKLQLCQIFNRNVVACQAAPSPFSPLFWPY